jgi:hypothetical protein
MERRSSSVDTSVCRHGRRRSAVTIIAPGEEVNPFQPDTVNGSAKKDFPPANARFDDFKANPREEDEVVNEAPKPASRAPPTASSRPQSYVSNGVNSSSNNIDNVPVAPGTLNTPFDPSRATKQAVEGGSGGVLPIPASSRMRVLRVFPNTPPTVVAPAQRLLSVRNGATLVVSTVPRGAPFPTDPNLSNSTHNPARTAATPDLTAARPAVRGNTTSNSPIQNAAANRQGQTSPARQRSTTPLPTAGGDGSSLSARQNSSTSFLPPGTGGNSSGIFNMNAGQPFVPTARRGSGPPPQAPPSPSAANWAAAARRQPLNTSAPSLAATSLSSSNAHEPHTTNNRRAGGVGGRRATVPRAASPPQRRVELVRVPHPPSRRTSLSPTSPNDQDTDSRSRRNASVPKPSALLLSVPAENSLQSGSGPRNDSFSGFSDTARESSIVVDDAATDVSDTPSIPTFSKPSRPLARAESPPADSTDFIKLTQRKKPAEMYMAPLSPHKRETRTTPGSGSGRKKWDTDSSGTSSEDESDDEGRGKDNETSSRSSFVDDALSQSTQSGRDDVDTNTDSGSNRRGGGSSSGRPALASVPGTSTAMQSTPYFSPLVERRKTLEPDAKLNEPQRHPRRVSSATKASTATAADTSVQEKSISSLADFELSSNNTLELTSFVTSSPTAGSQANTRQRRNHPAIRLPSPVDLNTVLLLGKDKNPMTSSPLFDSSKHRAGVAQSHLSKGGTRTDAASSPSAVDKSVSVGNWSFDYLAKNGLSNETQDDNMPELSLRRCDDGGASAVAHSPTSSKGGARSKNSKKDEKWRVTQSLSINPSEFSFDHLPLGQQTSSVAKLRKVFESQRKPRKTGSDAAQSGPSQYPPAQTKSPHRQNATRAPPLKTESLLATSAGSTVMAPRSEQSSGKAPLADGGNDSGRSAVVRTSACAPSLDFSFDRLTSPLSPAATAGSGRLVLPALPNSSRANPSAKAAKNPLGRSDGSEGEFRFSWAANTDGGLELNRHSAPSRTMANAKSGDGTAVLPSISLPASEGGFSLARFENSAASADTVNMFDRYDF